MKVTMKDCRKETNIFLLRSQNAKYTPTFLSKQIKGQIHSNSPYRCKRDIHPTKLAPATRVLLQPDYKHSVQTAHSYVSTCHHSAEKRKLSLQNPESPEKEHLQDLQQKNSHYTIKWKHTPSTVTKPMRFALGEWLMELANELSIPKNAVYNAMHYVDKYTSIKTVPRNRYQAVGLCALFASSKLEMADHPSINIFIEALDHSISRPDLISLEQDMLFLLKFKLNPPTLLQYMVLHVSLLAHFLASRDPSFANVKTGSQLYKDIFWVLDGAHLDNGYRNFKNKEKVCLAILYICLKKERHIRASMSRQRLMRELEGPLMLRQTEKMYEEFLAWVGGQFRLSDMWECVEYYRKWAKYDRSSVGEEEEMGLAKRIIFNN